MQMHHCLMGYGNFYDCINIFDRIDLSMFRSGAVCLQRRNFVL